MSMSCFVLGDARNLTMEQIVELETRFNAVPVGGDHGVVEAAAEPPLARRVKVLRLLGIAKKRYTPKKEVLYLAAKKGIPPIRGT